MDTRLSVGYILTGVYATIYMHKGAKTHIVSLYGSLAVSHKSKKTQLTGALHQLAGAALAFSMRSPLASLQQPV